VLLGSFKPWVSNAERYAAIFEREEPKADLARLGIRSPAALWARQLASQQTAFAIAGDGPIQSDAFPLLEYEAPRAFYIGINATVLRRFDERAEQWESCPDPKRLALQALTVDELKEQYRVMSTINADLAKGLEWEFRGQAFPPPPATVFSTASLQAAAAPPTVSEDLPEEIQRLQTAHAWIRTDRRLEGAAKIAELLERRTADSDWSPGYYAALAVKASLAESDAPQARRILKVALPLAPADDQLLYLNRIVERIAN
jgi:hypothetical protein